MLPVVLFAVMVLLSGCTSPEVVSIGPNRYHATQETRLFSARAQGAVAGAVRSYCAERGQRAELQLTEGRMSSISGSGVAVAEFSCQAR